jgi:non-heme chloroperoxidase
MLEKIALDRADFLAGFIAESYNTTWRFPSGVSERMLHYSWLAGVSASSIGTADCLAAWLTDFRADLRLIDVPVLVISGGRDRLLPFAATGARLGALIPRCRVLLLEDAPHSLFWTHAEAVNEAILDFVDR